MVAVVVVDVVVVDVVVVAGWTARRTCTVCGSRATRATPPTRSARTTATRSARTTATTTKRRPAVPARRPTAAAGGSTGSFFLFHPRHDLSRNATGKKERNEEPIYGL